MIYDVSQKNITELNSSWIKFLGMYKIHRPISELLQLLTEEIMPKVAPSVKTQNLFVQLYSQVKDRNVNWSTYVPAITACFQEIYSTSKSESSSASSSHGSALSVSSAGAMSTTPSKSALTHMLVNYNKELEDGPIEEIVLDIQPQDILNIIEGSYTRKDKRLLLSNLGLGDADDVLMLAFSYYMQTRNDKCIKILPLFDPDELTRVSDIITKELKAQHDAKERVSSTP